MMRILEPMEVDFFNNTSISILENAGLEFGINDGKIVEVGIVEN